MSGIKYLVAKKLALKTEEELQPHHERNVFKMDYAQTTEHQLPGPMFDRDGAVIESSIIGKAEWFQKVRESNKVPIETIVAESPKLSFKDCLFKSIATRRIPVQRGSIIKQGGQLCMPLKLYPKQELLEEMQLTKDRCEQNVAKIKQVTNQYKTDIKNFATKQERNLNRFTYQQNVWDERSMNISAKVGRSPNETLLNRSMGYRKRVEDIEVLSLVQTDEERLQNRFWYLKLRQYTPSTSKVQRRQRVDWGKGERQLVTPSIHSPFTSRHIQDDEHEWQNETSQQSDIYNGFNTRIAYNPHKQVEVIRRPRMFQSENSELYSKSFHMGFDAKMSTLQRQIRQKKVDITDLTTEMYIEGESVYDREYNSLLNDGEQGSYIKLDFAQIDPNEDTSENWQMRELSKRGIQHYPALLKAFE